MITEKQYDALGPLAREIIDTDRKIDAQNNWLATQPVLDINLGHTIRERTAERRRLSVAAAAICNRPSTRSSGPKAASAR